MQQSDIYLSEITFILDLQSDRAAQAMWQYCDANQLTVTRPFLPCCVRDTEGDLTGVDWVWVAKLYQHLPERRNI